MPPDPAWLRHRSGVLALLLVGGAAQSEEMAQVLDRHNALRCLHGSPPLAWSRGLAEAAQAWADQGTLGPSPVVGEGENIAWGPIPNGAAAVSFWYGERNTTNPQGSSAGDIDESHFTQVIWRGTTAVGCGKSIRLHNVVWVCRYAPKGNVPGHFADQVQAVVPPPGQCPSISDPPAPVVPTFPPPAHGTSAPTTPPFGDQAPATTQPVPTGRPALPSAAPPANRPGLPSAAIPGAQAETFAWALQGDGPCMESGYITAYACQDTMDPSLCSSNQYLLEDIGVKASAAGLPIGGTADQTYEFESDTLHQGGPTQMTIDLLSGHPLFLGQRADADGGITIRSGGGALDQQWFHIRADGLGEVLDSPCRGQLYIMSAGQQAAALEQKFRLPTGQAFSPQSGGYASIRLLAQIVLLVCGVIALGAASMWAIVSRRSRQLSLMLPSWQVATPEME